MADARWTFIPDILEEHIEGLAFLWGRRQAALRDDTITFPWFRDMEDRIAAHRDGIRVVGADARAMLEEKLAADDAGETCAGALALLDPAAGVEARVITDAFAKAEGPRLDGLKQALAHAGKAVLREVAALRQPDSTPIAAAAAEVLAFHRVLERMDGKLEPLLAAEDPSVRASGWRTVACAVVPVPPQRYAAAARDEDPVVVAAAMEAGAWCGVRGVLDAVRNAVGKNPAEQAHVLHLLGILGTDADVGLMREIVENETLGPGRFAMVVAGGRPDFMEYLFRGMESEDPETAVAAGAAFTKLTGLNIDSQRVVTVEQEGADEFEEEFADALTLPDPEAARREWHALSKQLQGVRHMATGRDIGALDAATFGAIDMRSRFEICMRARFYGTWTGTLVDIEKFPQRH